MKSYSQFKKQLFIDPEVQTLYDSMKPEFAFIQQIIEKRLQKGLTQSELAKKVGTKQSAIARLESGAHNPSIAFLQKVAQALDMHVKVSFV